jgi:hypothetical protein
MDNVLPLFPQQTTVPSSKRQQPQRAARPAASTVNPPKYLAQRHGIYYFKRKIPANLVQEFGNQVQIWKSLNTTDFAHACRELNKELAAFELRIATVRLRMASGLARENSGADSQSSSNTIIKEHQIAPFQSTGILPNTAKDGTFKYSDLSVSLGQS